MTAEDLRARIRAVRTTIDLASIADDDAQLTWLLEQAWPTFACQVN